MAENMMNSEHKATNKKYREQYDRIFNKGEINKKKKLNDKRSNVGKK